MTVPWPVVPLGEVVRHRKESVTIDDLATYRRPRVQLHAQGIVLRDEVTGTLIKTKSQQVCRTGDFLVAEIDAKVDGFGVVPESLDGSIVSSHYFLFSVDSAKLDRRFLNYFIRTPAFRTQVEAQGSTNYAAIRPGHVLGYQIPLPPLDEQQRIVARIEALAKHIEEARVLRSQAAEEAHALLSAARREAILGCPAQTVTLDSVCSAVIDNLHSNPRLSDTGVPCVRSPDVGYGTLNLQNAQRTSEAEYRRRTIRGEPTPDDIVLVREGGGTGKCALVGPGQRFSLGQRVMMLRPDPAAILPRYFLHQLLSPLLQEVQILPLSKGSASPHLNIGVLRKFSLRLPTLDDQRRIVEELDALSANSNDLRQLHTETAAQLDALLPAVLDRAFKGAL